MEDFESTVEEQLNDYIYVESSSLSLEMYPYHKIPVRLITELYGVKNNTHEFINKLYSLIHSCMAYPEMFQDEVYEAPLTYENLIEFLNEWINVSNLLRKYKAGEIDDNGEPTAKSVLNAVDIYEYKMMESMREDKDIKAALFIRWMSEHIKRVARMHNLVNSENKITKVVIDVEDK